MWNTDCVKNLSVRCEFIRRWKSICVFVYENKFSAKKANEKSDQIKHNSGKSDRKRPIIQSATSLQCEENFDSVLNLYLCLSLGNWWCLVAHFFSHSSSLNSIRIVQICASCIEPEPIFFLFHSFLLFSSIASNDENELVVGAERTVLIVPSHSTTNNVLLYKYYFIKLFQDSCLMPLELTLRQTIFSDDD